jgi:hypothetical protein
LTRCYTAQGWTEVARTVHPAESAGEGPLVEVQLRKNNGEVGYLLFCMYDGGGQPVVPRAGHWRNLRARLARNPLLFFLAPEASAISSEQTTLQIQQFVVTSSSLDETQLQDAMQLYRRTRSMIRARWLEQMGRNGTER